MNFVQSLGPAIFDTAMQSNVTLAEKVHQPRDAMTIAEKFAFSCSAAQLVVPVSAVNERNVDDLVRFAKEGGDPYPLTYDHVIIALGWHQDCLLLPVCHHTSHHITPHSPPTLTTDEAGSW